MSENIVDDYGWVSSKGLGSCGYISPAILVLLKDLESHRILDLGSGNGKLCSQLAQNGFEVVGVEYDRSGIEISRSEYPDISFYNYGVQDDPEELLKEESLFEVVVSTEVIEHLFSPHLLPVYARGALVDKGYLVITTPYHGYFKNLVLSVLNKWDSHFAALHHGGHIKFWSRKTITRLLQDNGFKIISFSGVGRIPYLWKSMLIVAQKT